MATYNYGLLEQAEEDNIHQSRLLSVEARPFQRITGRLLRPDSLINRTTAHLPTPPPEGEGSDEDAAATEEKRQKQAEERRIWREECTLDFNAYESSIVRTQLLHNSNERERERYTEEKLKIQETAQTIRDSTADLRIQLEAAQDTKASRLKWDQLAHKITSNRGLKPRDDQLPALQKLEDEIADLERESTAYAQTWAERREQFGRIVEEGRQMLRLIRDEKEEAERKEGMEDDEDGEDGEGTSKGEASHAGTPRPDGGMTPVHVSQEGDGVHTKSALQNEMLAPPTHGKGSGSNRGSPIRITSSSDDPLQDLDMQDSGVASRISDVQDDDDDDEGEIEDGEASENEDEEEGESMDVT